MAQDIRLDDAFFGHPKTVRFYRRTGDLGITCLFRLWCYASQYFPKGVLTGMTDEEIAAAAGWKGEPQEFIAALIEAGGPGKAGFLDRCGSHCSLHNWRKRNPYAYFREERSETSRKAAETRWGRRGKDIEKQDPNAERNAKRNADRNAEGNAPSPIPAPSPKDGARKEDASSPSAFVEAEASSLKEPTPEEREATLKMLREVQGKIGKAAPPKVPGNGEAKGVGEEHPILDLSKKLPKAKYQAVKDAFGMFTHPDSTKRWSKEQVDQNLESLGFGDSDFYLVEPIFTEKTTG